MRNNKLTKIIYKFSLKSLLKEIYGDEIKKIRTIKCLKNSFQLDKIINYLVTLVQLGVDAFILKLGTYESEFLSVSTYFQQDNLLKELYKYISNYFRDNKIKNKFGNDLFFVYDDFLYDIPSDIVENENILLDFSRQILADNLIIKKLKNNLSIVNCIKCGYCDSNINKYSATSCILCPNKDMKIHFYEENINENRFELSSKETKNSQIVPVKKVAIIGAGVSGIHSAIFLIERGYFVELYEKKRQIK